MEDARMGRVCRRDGKMKLLDIKTVVFLHVVHSDSGLIR
jgi:hypothetical protein